MKMGSAKRVGFSLKKYFLLALEDCCQWSGWTPPAWSMPGALVPQLVSPWGTRSSTAVMGLVWEDGVLCRHQRRRDGVESWMKLLPRKEIPGSTSWRVPSNDSILVLWKVVKKRYIQLHIIILELFSTHLDILYQSDHFLYLGCFSFTQCIHEFILN